MADDYKKLDPLIEKELRRLGLGEDFTVSRERVRLRKDGEVDYVEDTETVDISPGEGYVRGRPEDILPVLRSIRVPSPEEQEDQDWDPWEAVWEAMKRAGIYVGVYPCSWEMGDDVWPDIDETEEDTTEYEEG